jgi:DNA (cytosine-5)-methyltransferase 1
MFKGQFGKAEYSDIAFSITTRIDAAGCFGIIEYNNTSDDLETMEEVIQVGNIVDDTDIGFKNPQRGRIYSSDGLSPCLCDGSGGGGREPKIMEFKNFISLGDQNDSYNRVCKIDNYCGALNCTKQMEILEPIDTTEPLRIPQATKQGYIEIPPGSLFDASYPNSTTRRGRAQEGGQISPTLMAGGEAPCHYEGKESTSYRIRKLTPRECFRLMDVDEKNIDKIIASGVSNSQQYKMAGNSIVTNCMYHLFRKLFIDTQTESQQLSLF